MKSMKKFISMILLAVVLTTTISTPKAKAATDPYAALASATIAAYVLIAVGGTLVIAGVVWTIQKVASKEVAIQEAKDDAMIFLANDGQAPSLLLETIFASTREKLAESMSEEELAEFTDVRLAEMMISGVTAELVE